MNNKTPERKGSDSMDMKSITTDKESTTSKVSKVSKGGMQVMKNLGILDKQKSAQEKKSLMQVQKRKSNGNIMKELGSQSSSI